LGYRFGLEEASKNAIRKIVTFLYQLFLDVALCLTGEGMIRQERPTIVWRRYPQGATGGPVATAAGPLDRDLCFRAWFKRKHAALPPAAIRP